MNNECKFSYLESNNNEVHNEILENKNTDDDIFRSVFSHLNFNLYTFNSIIMRSLCLPNL